MGLTPEVERLLSAHDWPGNVRELENLVERLTVLHSGEEIRVEHLPETFRETMPEGTSRKFSAVEIPDEGVNLNDLLRRFEGDLIDRALKKTDGVKSDAAALLGLKRTTLVERMKKRSLTG